MLHAKLCRWLLAAFPLFLSPAWAQLKPEQTGVPTEALQQSFWEMISWSSAHGQLCTRTLKQAVPGVRGMPTDLDIEHNMAGITTSRWSQEVTRPDGTKSVVWRFECVSRLQSGPKVIVISLVMYEQRGAEKRGVELLTKRDVHIDHKPR